MSRGGLGSSGGVQCAGRGFALSALADGRSAKRASVGFRKVWQEEACKLRPLPGSVRRGRRTGGLVARAVSSEEEGNAKDAGEKRSTTSNRAYRITIRGREAFRYTIPGWLPCLPSFRLLGGQLPPLGVAYSPQIGSCCAQLIPLLALGLSLRHSSA